jgi:hypothetical protein
VLNASNIWLNPAQTTEYGTAYGEVWGGGSGQANWGGATVGLPVGRLGIFIARPYTGNTGALGLATGAPLGGADESAVAGTITSAGNAFGQTLAVIAPARNIFDILYGAPVGDKASVGVRVSYALDKVENTSQTQGPSVNNKIDKKADDLNFAFGALLKDVLGMSMLDVAFDVSLVSVDNTYSDGTGAGQNANFKSDGNVNFGFLLRPVWQKDDATCIWSFRYDRFNTSSKGDTDTSGATAGSQYAFDDKADQISINYAHHQKQTDRLKMIWAGGLNWMQRTNKFTNNLAGAAGNDINRKEQLIALPIAMALEHQTFSKAVTRFGVSHEVYRFTKAEVNDPETAGSFTTKTNTQGRGTTLVSLGLGYKPTDDVDFDIGLNTPVFNFGSGLGTSVTRASLRYHY